MFHDQKFRKIFIQERGAILVFRWTYSINLDRCWLWRLGFFIGILRGVVFVFRFGCAHRIKS